MPMIMSRLSFLPYIEIMRGYHASKKLICASGNFLPSFSLVKNFEGYFNIGDAPFEEASERDVQLVPSDLLSFKWRSTGIIIIIAVVVMISGFLREKAPSHLTLSL